MRRVSHGDRDHRAAERGPIEISQLAKGLNGMLDAIEQAEESEAQQRYAREQMAERLRQTETMAALGQLSAGVAHELGAPLTVVDGRASRLLRRLHNDNDIKELNEIRQQAARMTSIIQQLLSFGRSSRAEMRDLDVTSLLERAEALLADHGYQIRLIKNSSAIVRGDSLSLEQALVNLLRNACQACPDGPVELSWEQRDEQLIIHIDDAGPGINDEQQQQIFEPFVTTKAPGEGSGLGLAIVKRILREHQGEVMLTDSPLGGARFSLILPLVKHTDSGTIA